MLPNSNAGARNCTWSQRKQQEQLVEDAIDHAEDRQCPCSRNCGPWQMFSSSAAQCRRPETGCNSSTRNQNSQTKPNNHKTTGAVALGVIGDKDRHNRIGDAAEEAPDVVVRIGIEEQVNSTRPSSVYISAARTKVRQMEIPEIEDRVSRRHHRLPCGLAHSGGRSGNAARCSAKKRGLAGPVLRRETPPRFRPSLPGRCARAVCGFRRPEPAFRPMAPCSRD